MRRALPIGMTEDMDVRTLRSRIMARGFVPVVKHNDGAWLARAYSKGKPSEDVVTRGDTKVEAMERLCEIVERAHSNGSP